jgi:hypothetical protein
MQSHCNAVRGLGLGITLSGRMAETALYLPVKRHLESQGYTVKSEIKSCDVVAVRGDESPVIVELKTGMTIQLLFQAVDRLAMTDFVYVAIERPKRGVTSQALKLCRRIGIGLIVVAASGSLEVRSQHWWQHAQTFDDGLSPGRTALRAASFHERRIEDQHRQSRHRR